MRKVILQEFISLDGLAAGDDGNTDFVPASTNGDLSFIDDQMKLMDQADTMLLGRKTYEMFADYWPKASDGDEKEFADKLNAMHKIVCSNSITSAPWGDWEEGTILRGDATKELGKVKAGSGKDLIVWGSISLSQSLLNAGMIDECRLVTCPIVLGSGRRFFDDKVHQLNMKLLEATTFDNGEVELKYVPAKTAAKKSAG